jgi:hypothetical protein
MREQMDRFVSIWARSVSSEAGQSISRNPMRLHALDNLIFVLRRMKIQLAALQQVSVNYNHDTDESLDKAIICPFRRTLDQVKGFYFHGEGIHN